MGCSAVAILIPTFGRPHKVESITRNVLASTPNASVYFCVEDDDKATQEAVATTEGANLIVNTRTRSYSGAINTGVLETCEPYVFAGADDLFFMPGWFELAEAMMSDTIKVVGTNDMGNPEVLAGSHATHFLVEREYAFYGVIDSPGIMLFEGYDHNWTDKEFVLTAQKRNAYAHCHEAVVEHHHWAWNKAGIDATYSRGMRSEPTDREVFMRRQHLWT